jgi:hypothetical protein
MRLAAMAADRVLLVLTGAVFFTALVCAWILAECIFFTLMIGMRAAAHYEGLGGRLPGYWAAIARDFGIIPTE